MTPEAIRCLSGELAELERQPASHSAAEGLSFLRAGDVDRRTTRTRTSR
jgi:hypothetical protein